MLECLDLVGSEPSRLASFSRAAASALVILPSSIASAEQAFLDGVLLDVLLDGSGWLRRRRR